MTREAKDKTFGNGLNDFIGRNKLSGVELAKALGITSANISTYKSGKAFPSYPVLKTLIGLGMTLEEMFGEDMARKAVQDYTQEQARKDPVSTAHQAKAVLELLLEQVSKIGQA